MTVHRICVLACSLTACAVVVWWRCQLGQAGDSETQRNSGLPSKSIAQNPLGHHVATATDEKAPPVRSTGAKAANRIAYGKEFWLEHTEVDETTQAPEAPFDLTRVMDRVRHAVQADSEKDGQVHGDRFSVRFGRAVTWTSMGDTERSGGDEAGDEPSSRESRQIVLRSSLGSHPPPLGGGQESNPWIFEGNTAQRELEGDGSVLEHYQVLERGLEITWIVGGGGPAPTEVSLDVGSSGLSMIAASDSKTVLSDGEEPVVKVESLGAVDESGNQVTVDFELAENGRMTFRMASNGDDSGQGKVAIRALLTPTFDLTRPVVHPTQILRERRPAMAPAGKGIVAVWETGVAWDQTYSVMGTRISKEGRPLDIGGVEVRGPARSKRRPTIAHRDGKFLVVWQDVLNWTWQIHSVCLSPDGERMVETAAVRLSDRASEHFNPVVASTEEGFLVVWQEGVSEDGRLIGRHLSADGKPLEPFQVFTETGSQTQPAIASTGEQCLIVWQHRTGEDSQIRGRYFDAKGNAVSEGSFPISQADVLASQPAVTVGNSGFLVAWETEGPTGSEIHAARVFSPQTVGEIRVVTEEGEEAGNPALASRGGEFFLAWERHASDVDVVGRRLDAEGSPRGSVVSISTEELNQRSPSVLSMSNGFMVAWSHESPAPGFSDLDIYGRFISGNPEMPASEPIALSVEANQTELPRAATNGENIMVVWPDNRKEELPLGGEGSVFAARVSPEGDILDPEGIEIRSAPEDYQWPPHVASNGQDYLVVWGDTRGEAGTHLYGARIAGDGRLLDPGGFAISREPFRASLLSAVAGNDNGYLTVIESNRDIYAIRVLSDGTVLDDPPIGIDVDPDVKSFNPQVASDGRDFFVLWKRLGDGFPVYGRRVLADGSLPEASPFLITRIGEFPMVQSNGDNYLVAWFGRSSVRNESGLLFQRFDRQTRPLDDQPVFLGPWGPWTVGTDGKDYLIAWHFNWDIHGTLISSDGEVLTPEPLLMAAGNVRQEKPAVSFLGGRWFVAYSEWNPTSNGPRIRARFVDLDPTLPSANYEVGSVGLPGGASFDSGMITLQGSGFGLTEGIMGFHLLERPVTGNASITARLIALPEQTGEEVAGVIMRGGETVGAALLSLTADSGGKLQFLRRPENMTPVHIQAAGTARFPVWLRLVGLEDYLLAYTSSDGFQWDPVGVAQVKLPAETQVGLVVTSGKGRELATGLFDNVFVTPNPPPGGGARSLPRVYASRQWVENGGFQEGTALALLVTGTPHTDYLVEFTEDLDTWELLGTVDTGAFGAAVFTDTEPPERFQRFYRISTKNPTSETQGAP